jgi:protein CWC15
MTTAHRPTWAPARGGEEQGGLRLFVASRARSAKDQPGQLTMKVRGAGQGAAGELGGKDLKAELEAKEREHARKTKGVDFEEERKRDLALLEAAAAADGPEGDRGRDGGGGGGPVLMPRAQDADDEDESGSSDDDDDDDDDDEEDDEAALMAELERIRAERAAEAERRAAEEEERREKEKMEALRTGNPLLSIGGADGAGGSGSGAGGGAVDFGVKRRWDEDVVFKNTTRGEVKAPRRFINDTVRSDFHRRFLERYIK